MNYERTVDAESESLSLTDVRDHLRITTSDDDDSIRFMIASIRKQTEHHIGKTLVTSTWECKFDSFETEMNLPMGPIQSITTVAYTDTDGNGQTFTDYQYDSRGRLQAAYGYDWPSTREMYDAVTITYICGQTHAGNVDEDIKHAMLLWIGAADMSRENDIIGTIITEIPNSARDLLTTHRKLVI